MKIPKIADKKITFGIAHLFLITSHDTIAPIKIAIKSGLLSEK